VSLGVRAISHIAYRAWDREASYKFFIEGLGFYPQERGRITYAGLGETLVEFMQADPDEEHLARSERYVFGVEVSDIHEALERLQGLGATVVRPIFKPSSFWGSQAVISVPGGPNIALREYRSPDGPHFSEWHPE
jgi:predicted enzyme related to lactoylglutathione lyase